MTVTSNSFGQVLLPHLGENEEFSVDQENIVFVGHATEFWDGTARKSEPATRKLIKMGRENNYHIIATAAEHMMSDVFLAQQHYFQQEEIDLLVTSRPGAHRLQFPNLKNIFFVGGNLNRCLCEGIRDVAIGLYQNSDFSEVNFYLVTDGIYAAYNPYSPIVEPQVAVDFSRSFFTPAFKCPLQNWGRATLKRVKMPEVQLNIYWGDQLIENLAAEKSDKTPVQDKIINIRYIHSSDLEKYL